MLKTVQGKSRTEPLARPLAAEQLAASLKQKEEELQAVISSARSILGKTSFDQSARAIFDHCCHLTGATSGYVALLSDDGSENEVLFLEDGGMQCTVDPDLPMPIRGLREEAYRKNCTVYDNDFKHSPWMAMMPAGHMDLRNVMFAPLVLDGRTVGIMGVANKDGDFTDRDAEIAAVLGELAVIALQNARFHEDRQRTTALLAEQELKFRTLLNNQQDAVFLHRFSPDQLFPFSEVNDTALQRYGYSRAEMMQMTILDIQADLSGRIDKLRESLRTEGQVTFETHHKTKQGKSFPVEVNTSLIDMNGQRCILSTARDISLRKESEQKLRQSRERYRQVVDHAPLGIATVTQNGRITGANPFLCRMLGYTEKELMGMDVEQITHPDDYSTEQQILTEMARREWPSVQLEKRYIHKDGRTVWGQLTTRMVSDDEGKARFGLGMVEDISEKKEVAAQHQKLEAKLKESQALVFQQEKMASIGQLAAGVAHEINNPLGFIKSNLNSLGKYLERIAGCFDRQQELLQDHPILEQIKNEQKQCKLAFALEDSREIISESREGVDRASTIIQDLKSFSRAESGQPVPVELNTCLDKAINLLWNEIKYTAKLERSYSDNLPPLTGFPQRLEQVFINLLMNAAQAIGQGADGLIQVATLRADNGLKVSIRDNGCGMTEQQQQRIFEPFFTTKEVGQGTGLGMSICYEIIRSHGGSIEVSSEAGSGTDIRILIPLQGGDLGG